MPTTVEVTGLRELVAELKGPMFKNVNKELRQYSKLIATDIKPLVEQGVRESSAPQADALAKTVRVVSDRVPVVSVGRTNPPLKGWRGKGTAAGNKRRRGAMAHGVVYGGFTPNYYVKGRDDTGGSLGKALQANGKILKEAEELYLRFYFATLKAHGWGMSNLRRR